MDASSRDPVDQSDVLAAIRTLQDFEFAKIEADLREKEIEERKAAHHAFRMDALMKVVAVFRAVIAEAPGAGMVRFPAWRADPHPNVFARLKFKPDRMPERHGWPFAARVVPVPTYAASTNVVVLDVEGKWWEGHFIDRGPTYSLHRPLNLLQLDDPKGFLSVGPAGPPNVIGVSGKAIDEAVVLSIAALLNEYELQWPA